MTCNNFHCSTYPKNHICYRDKAGNLDRKDGPALVFLENGSQYYYIHGLFHREDGPAVILPDAKSWHVNGIKIN